MALHLDRSYGSLLLPQDAQACAEESARLRIELQAALKEAVHPAEAVGQGAAGADHSGERVAELEAQVSELQSRLAAASDAVREPEPSPSSCGLESELQAVAQRASTAEAKVAEADRLLQDHLAASAGEAKALRSRLAKAEAESEEAATMLAASEQARADLAEALAEAGGQAKEALDEANQQAREALVEAIAKAERQASTASLAALSAAEQRALEADARAALAVAALAEAAAASPAALAAAELRASEAEARLARECEAAQGVRKELEARLAQECEAVQGVRKELERAEQSRAELATDLNVANRKLTGATERIVLMTGRTSSHSSSCWGEGRSFALPASVE